MLFECEVADVVVVAIFKTTTATRISQNWTVPACRPRVYQRHLAEKHDSGRHSAAGFSENVVETRLQNSPYFCVFKDARAVKQKVWNET